MAWKYVKFTIKFNTVFKILISSLVMGFAVNYLVESLAATWQAKVVVLAVPFGALVYVIMLGITGAITKDMLKIVFKKDR